MKSSHTSAKQVQMMKFILDTTPEKWPTLDEFPETDTGDLVQAYRDQSTIDREFEQV